VPGPPGPPGVLGLVGPAGAKLLANSVTYVIATVVLVMCSPSSSPKLRKAHSIVNW
jgi:hypothetical protein